MTPTLTNPQRSGGFEKALGLSVIFHVCVFIFIAVRAVFAPSEAMLAPPSIRVDIVDLPDHAPKLPPVQQQAPVPAPPAPEPVAPKPAPAPEPPAPPKVNLNKTKHDEAAALRRLEALAKMQKAVESEHKAVAAAPTLPPSQPIKGNEVTPGSSLRGITKLENQNYTQVVQTHVTRHWNLPGFLSDANLSAMVRVFVDGRGNLLKKALVRSSNNAVFDQSAMAAVDSSLPLPPPPEDLANLVSVRGIDIDFTPEH